MPVEKARRETLRKATRTDTIPTLVDERGTVLVGEDEIRTFLDSEIVEPAGAGAHRLKGANARRLYLEEECECLQPAKP